MNNKACPHCGSTNCAFVKHGKTAPAKDGKVWITKRWRCYNCNLYHWESVKVDKA